ncbi:hypothetical protein A2W14_05730 [Candidatus Gottesmanbacteria bacterium RBG_16_37_8]|uniref:IMP dehydrogenase/GMP reductase domain-containing protein n=1 Tax=Candidatus Gottesmanbacteria bacterium RBG_16_37_8 TaxID=1798371 RepID=A0A1F5YUQ2_9BACT|nr:MAG: hypothetical protein A2W14_05730 [Candidatus Gottesmanbacteria bacterium RBG_16_37_8]
MDQSDLYQQKISSQQGLTFDDVLLLPNYTEIKRETIDVSTCLTKKIKLQIPLLSAPMDTVTEDELAISLGKLGGLGIIHRNLTIVKQVNVVAKVKKEIDLVGASVGIGRDLQERVIALDKAGCNVLVIDSAHGFSKWVIEATRYISGKFPHIELISGSVATAGGAKALIEAGAKALRVGMGPGSICTTRLVAGMGVPQITAVLETVKIARKFNIPVISDGGLRFSGDIVKALSCGASSVMTGSLLAGSKESPGKIVTLKGKKYKSYRGMGSIAAMRQGSAQRYGQEYRRGQEKKLIPEGVEGLVAFKGTIKDIVNQLVGGLKTGMYYAGVKNIRELQENTRLIRLTQASLIESHPHNIIVKES